MKKSGRRWFVIIGVLAVLTAVAVFTVPRVLANQSKGSLSGYQTARVSYGDLTAFVGATGTVRSNQSTVLAWQTTGTIGKVNAALRQQVTANTVLAELDEGSLPQAVIMAQADLVNSQQALDTLMTTSTDRANAQLALVQAQKAVDDAQKKRQSLQFQRASQETIDIARANLIQAKSALDDATTIYNRNKTRNSDDPVYAAALSQYASAKQRYDQANLNLLYVQGLPSPLDVQEADANLQVAEAKLQSAKQTWDQLKDGPNPQDVTAAKARVAAAQATLNLVRITAPFNGTITAVNIKPGDQATPGLQAFQLDDLSHLYIDIAVSEVDIDRIKTGQPVTLTLDAIQGKQFQGSVSEISPVASADKTGAVNFTVTVEITDDNQQIRPGMTTAANIAVSQLKNVLLVPNRAIRTQDGRRIVYLIRNGQLESKEITLGSSSNAYSEVTDGDVHEGDEIVLNPPSANPFAQGGGPGGGGFNRGG